MIQQGSVLDCVIINVNVEEKVIGEVLFGVGYFMVDGVVGDIFIIECNFFGCGQFVWVFIGGGVDI